MFVLGQTNSTKDIQTMVKKESEMYNDIVQENFNDTYNNLTYKSEYHTFVDY